MLNIEEFSPDKKYEKKDDNTEEIKQYYEKIIQKIIKEKYEEGFKEGYTKAEQTTKEKLIQKHNREKEELLKKIEKLKQDFEKEKEKILKEYTEQLKENLYKEFDKIKLNLSNILLNSLEDILDILYISPENTKFLKEKITEIINSFEGEKLITIIVNEEVLPYFEDFNFKVEAGNVEKGNFIIKFESFSIESSFKEKMETLKNEIKREIKGNT